MNDRGAFLREGAGERLGKAIRRGRHGRDAERARGREEVGLAEVDGGRLAERVALVLPQDPVAAVVDEQDGVEPVLARGGQFREAVEDAAVPGDRQHSLPGAASEAPSAAGQA